MANLVLLKHGEIQFFPDGSQTGHLAPGSCIEMIRMAEAALGAIPERLRWPRPSILSGIEKEATVTATLIAHLFHTAWTVRPALSETIDRAELREFAAACLAADRPIIAVSHEHTINALADELKRQNGPYTDRRNGPLVRYQGLAIDTQNRNIDIIKAPPFFASDP
jgi:broad specificity phosphatase PhoE